MQIYAGVTIPKERKHTGHMKFRAELEDSLCSQRDLAKSTSQWCLEAMLADYPLLLALFITPVPSSSTVAISPSSGSFLPLLDYLL